MDRDATLQAIARLVGVPDGNIRNLWRLWSGEGGELVDDRHAVLEAIREARDGERVMANLVTFSVLVGLGGLSRTATPDQILEAFSGAELRQLTAWAERPKELAEALRR